MRQNQFPLKTHHPVLVLHGESNQLKEIKGMRLPRYQPCNQSKFICPKDFPASYILKAEELDLRCEAGC